MSADRVDELYALPPSEFTAARNALVKQLRAEKRREEADEVKGLRRPNLPAWAINQVVRSDADVVERLLAAGADVAAAQRRALSGVRNAGLREASTQRRERLDDVWKIAARFLREAGVDPQPHRPAIAATLEAASLDPAVAAEVRLGRLTADLPAPSGFGDVMGLSVVAAAEGKATDDEEPLAPDDTRAEVAERARLEQELVDAESEAKRVLRRATELQERAAQRRREAVKATAESERLERRAAQVRQTAQAETTAADDLAADAERAARAADDAQDRAAQLRAALGR
jgi:hypothetical protein